MEENYTKVVFIVFEKPSDVMKVIKEEDGFFWGRFKRMIMPSCCFSNETFWMFERAPEPDDIYWENMNYTTCERVFRSFWSYIFTVFIIGGSLAILVFIKKWQR